MDNQEALQPTDEPEFTPERIRYLLTPSRNVVPPLEEVKRAEAWLLARLKSDNLSDKNEAAACLLDVVHVVAISVVKRMGERPLGDADDITSDASIKINNYISNFNSNIRPLSTWITVIVNRCMIDIKRREKLERKYLGPRVNKSIEDIEDRESSERADGIPMNSESGGTPRRRNIDTELSNCPR